MALRTLSLCSGIGGLDLGVGLATRTRSVAYVERDPYAASTLVARMEDETLDRAPVWDDLKTFDGQAWRGCVDLVLAGYPCQPFSVAGERQGEDDERHLWPHVKRIIEETGAPLAFLENVPGHLRLGFDAVLGDLHQIGFDAEWCHLSAGAMGAPHRRERLWILAYRDGDGLKRIRESGIHKAERKESGNDSDRCDANVGHALRPRLEERRPRSEPRPFPSPWPPGPAEDWTEYLERGGPAPAQPRLRRGVDGTAARVDRLRCLGNGVVPVVAAAAFRHLVRRLI